MSIEQQPTDVLEKSHISRKIYSGVCICRLQTADCRPQIADCKLIDTKNLPNKSDVIKKISSFPSQGKRDRLFAINPEEAGHGPKCIVRSNQSIMSPHLFIAYLRSTKHTQEIKTVFAFISRCAIFFAQYNIGLISKMLLPVLHRLFIDSPGVSLIALTSRFSIILSSSWIIVN